MPEPKHIDAAFTSPEDAQYSEPRAISWLAITAFALGWVSAGALVAPIMWILPVAGVAVAVAALRSIAADPERRIGRSLAVAGLILSLLFASWGVSNYFTRRHLVYRQAEALAKTWLRMVLDGRLREAHQLTIPQDQRRSPETDLADFYDKDEETRTSYADYWKRPPMQDLVEAGPDASIRFLQDEKLEHATDSSDPTDLVTQRFEIDYEKDGQPHRLEVRMVMARTRDRRSGEARWRVTSVSPVGDRSR
jgi:hypothetical protein